LYINLTMLKDSPKRIGEMLEISVEFDDSDRTILMHPDLEKAIKKNPIATKNFESLIPSMRLEVVRYINNLKTAESIERNIGKIIRYLIGEGDFFGKKIK